jgi:bacterioferritin
MKGNPRVIELLNEALKAELTAINQYWLHYRMLDNWGVKKLAALERHESIDEMKHADRFSERILFLEGMPNFQALGSLRIGESVEEILKADLVSQRGRRMRSAKGLCQPRPVRRGAEGRGGACRRARDAVRDDPPDGAPELYPAAVRAGRGLT